MRIFDAHQVQQGSDLWWNLRRGIPTASSMDKILTAKKMLPSEQQDDLIAELAADVAYEEASWLTERLTKPPNKAVQNGIEREAESRKWLEFERDCSVLQVGFCLHDNGLWGASPDGILFSDSGLMFSSLELKNPMLHTQVKYVTAGNLPGEYRAQCAGHLIVTGLAECLFLSYAPPLPPLLVTVRADEFAVRLKEELELFTARYLNSLERLGLLERFRQQRSNTLAHFPQGSPS